MRVVIAPARAAFLPATHHAHQVSGGSADKRRAARTRTVTWQNRFLADRLHVPTLPATTGSAATRVSLTHGRAVASGRTKAPALRTVRPRSEHDPQAAP